MQVFMKIINNSEAVPLQLSVQRAEEIRKEEMKDHSNLLKSNKGHNNSQKSQKKLSDSKETGKYKNLSKVIKSIQYNISVNKPFLSIDIETYEKDKNIITEIGWCVFKSDGVIKKRKHAIVEENVDYHNGNYIPDHRNNFLFGRSETQKLSGIEEELKKDIEKINYLVGHGIKNDIRYLNSININTSKFENMKNSKIPEFGIIDTMDLYSGFYYTRAVGLEKSLLKLQIPYDKLHNAGKKKKKKKKKKNIYIYIYIYICIHHNNI